MKNLKIFTKQIESKAKEQIDLLLEQEAFKDCKIRIMPDVHAGVGCVIGFTADLGDKIIPNIVGVDIGCGMTWVKTELKEEDIDLVELDKKIRAEIPSGMNVNQEIKNSYDLDIEKLINSLHCKDLLKNKDKYIEKSLGTLGGGNHFIEIDKNKDGYLYLIVHSGSRNLGKQVCEIYQNKAIENCSYKKEMALEKKEAIKSLKEQGKQKDIEQALDEINNKYKGKTKLPKDLCYLEGEESQNYLDDMELCQEYASANRRNIINEVLRILDYNKTARIYQTIHNYIGEDNIVRKGAISAYKNELVLIPMNMRDGCIIGKGLGNSDWNKSAPHGAGRLMSRHQAREELKMADFENQMKDIYTTSVCKETIDESPMAYKPMEDIIENIKDTVDIVEIIKPIYNFKAKE